MSNSSEIKFKFDLRGYRDIEFVLRAENGKEALDKLQAALDVLEKIGASSYNGNGSNSNNSNTPNCQYHGKMSKSTKNDGWYCTKKMGDGSYCKETKE